jgi:hypothetical protein
VKRSPLAPSVTPLTRTTGLSRGSTGLSRGKGLKPVSDRRRAENDPEDGAWTLLRAERFAIDTNPVTGLVVCQALGLLPGRCWGEWACHHLYRTGQGYERLCSVDRLRSVCEGHHTGYPNGIHVDHDRARRVELILG